MGLVQYFVHTMIGAAATAFKTGETIWQMWTRNFLWISISYFSGAAGAGLIVSSMGTSRIWALLICIPIIIIVYYSYDRYMREVKASARYAEEAERARAEIEHERAEQAERHVQERSEEHTSELQSRLHLVCRLLLEKKKQKTTL